jgi:hypothetical protein
MKTITVKYNYFDLQIEHSIHIFELIKTMPEAIRIETLLELLETLDEKIVLNDLQISILKTRMKRINKILKFD